MVGRPIVEVVRYLFDDREGLEDRYDSYLMPSIGTAERSDIAYFLPPGDRGVFHRDSVEGFHIGKACNTS